MSYGGGEDKKPTNPKEKKKQDSVSNPVQETDVSVSSYQENDPSVVVSDPEEKKYYGSVSNPVQETEVPLPISQETDPSVETAELAIDSAGKPQPPFKLSKPAFNPLQVVCHLESSSSTLAVNAKVERDSDCLKNDTNIDRPTDTQQKSESPLKENSDEDVEESGICLLNSEATAGQSGQSNCDRSAEATAIGKVDIDNNKVPKNHSGIRLYKHQKSCEEFLQPHPPAYQTSAYGSMEILHESFMITWMLLWIQLLVYELFLIIILQWYIIAITPFIQMSQVQMAECIRTRWFTPYLQCRQNHGIIQRGTPLAESTNRFTGPQFTVLGRGNNFELIQVSSNGSLYSRMQVSGYYLPALRMRILFFQRCIGYPSIPYLHGITWNSNYFYLYYNLNRVNSVLTLSFDNFNTFTINYQIFVGRYSFELPFRNMVEWQELIQVPIPLVPINGLFDFYIVMIFHIR